MGDHLKHRPKVGQRQAFFVEKIGYGGEGGYLHGKYQYMCQRLETSNGWSPVEGDTGIIIQTSLPYDFAGVIAAACIESDEGWSPVWKLITEEA